MSALDIQIEKPISSDGGSSAYYDMKLKDTTIAFINENGYIKTEQLIKDCFGNDFDFGNAFKSLVRAYGITCGAGKKGNSIDYECNKIIYSVEKIKKFQEKE